MYILQTQLQPRVQSLNQTPIISQGSVATRLGYGGIFNGQFVTNESEGERVSDNRPATGKNYWQEYCGTVFN